MLLFFCYVPFAHIYFREPGVGLLGFLLYEGGVDLVGKGQSLAIDASPADDEDLLVLGLQLESHFQGIIEHAVMDSLLHGFSLSCDDHVAAVGECSVG